MLTKDMHKPEIEAELEGKGDFVKIDYLTRYLKEMPPIEMRKFAYLKLAEVYLKKGMYADAAASFKNAAVNSVTFREKQDNYLKESKTFILALRFDESDKALRKAMDEANNKEKREIYLGLVEFYKKEISKWEKQDKPGQLMKIYEKFLRLKIEDEEKEEVKDKLLNLYERLGKIKEARILRSTGKV